MSDRTYFHVTTRPHAPRRAWHALAPADPAVRPTGVCGFVTKCGASVDGGDRVPPDAHLCGNCARVIAAQTDVEP